MFRLSLFLEVVIMVSFGVLKRHAGCYNHSDLVCLNVMRNKPDLSGPNQLHLIFFLFLNLNTYLKCVRSSMIYSVFNSNLLLLCGCNLALDKASIKLRQPTVHIIASISMEN